VNRCLVAGGGTTARLARTIYDDRRLEDMPVLDLVRGKE
jgi:hypothetical protein